ncbi:T9SS type A sorting domain-containing protein [Putridiphycobacter roseus]|nr:T9SS type A sorting domain-containing protein [Putridiphycobacter roseus]
MKKIGINLIIIIAGLASFSFVGPNAKNNTGGLDGRAAGCTFSDGFIFMEFNNVKARIETGGILWTERAISRAAYEVPKTDDFKGPKVIYSGALWMGGTDNNGQLRLAAQKFVQDGPDFWAGPLSTFGGNPGNYDPSLPQDASLNIVRANGDAEIIPEECAKYDQFFTIDKGTVLRFSQWWLCQQGLLPADECESVTELSADTMLKILNWPAHGDVSLGQDYYLAPFYDNPNGPEGLNGRYDPIIDGDYPWYDLNDDVDCRDDRRVTLFGDETNWWVFNDKGNIHQASQGEPIGMEIRAQAFSFATNDEINDMTFYNYEMINRGTQTLKNAYFAQYVDPDIGGNLDDYVGCDVGRGLGFCFNGDGNDDAGSSPYKWGANPPAIGIDFFEGPYQDADAGIVNFPGLPSGDNPLTESTPAGSQLAYEYKGIPYEGLGIGYGDSIPDNERMGMRRFFYYNNVAGGILGDPDTAPEFYGFMDGFWGASGNPQTFGDNGLTGSVPSNFMFPGDSDPAGWATAAAGQAPDVSAGVEWSEISAGNATGDRRFAQVAGPFTLKPGALNNLTVGVVYGRSFDGDLLASVNAMKTADSKAQSLFDACFEILEPPLAPKMSIQEMENELIILLDGSQTGTEDYEEIDEINIPIRDEDGNLNDRSYRFQGYQVFQMINADASVSDITEIEMARLVAQCDIVDGVSKLVNYEFNEEDGISVPKVKVDGDDKGLQHSFRITEDLFATGDRTLINHKKYYYIAVSYAHNEFLKYDPNTADGIPGQKTPYLVSRRSASFGQIESVTAIPHNPSVEADGTVYGTYYGWTPKIKQIEGEGNGGNELELSASSLQEILENNEIDVVEYANGGGPVDVKVIDPLNLQSGDYILELDKNAGISRGAVKSDTYWRLIRTNGGTVDTVLSDYTIGTANEQIIPEWGISVSMQQYEYGGELNSTTWTTSPISSSIKFADSSKIWLSGVMDSDINFTTNWIRAGSSVAPADDDESCSPTLWVNNPCYYYDRAPITDASQSWEGVLDGIMTSFKYVGYEVYGMPMGNPGDNPTTEANEGYFKLSTTQFSTFNIAQMHDVDVIITSDQSLWTKCPVIEMNDNENQTVGGSDVLELRGQASINKDGSPVTDGDQGMGWFPGYAINVSTGKRLNMLYGENSWLGGDNGNDMIWNPSHRYVTSTGEPLMGGMHYVYILDAVGDMPVYDEGKYAQTNLAKKTKAGHEAVFDYCTWIAEPMGIEFRENLETDVTIKARVSKPYTERDETKGANKGMPKYGFSITESDRVQTGVTSELESLLDIINVVPNPYYAYSEYEDGRLDNQIKITNLPEVCNVKIFNMQGSLIRQYTKDDPLTSLNWDLTNTVGVPIASGVYIIHIEVPGVGEKILKWFGTMRKVDLDNI